MSGKLTGPKQSEGKAPWDLIPWEVMHEVVQVYDFGATKYKRDSWKGGISKHRLFAAVMRHLIRWHTTGEQRDGESGAHHLASVIFYCLTWMWYERFKPEAVDEANSSG